MVSHLFTRAGSGGSTHQSFTRRFHLLSQDGIPQTTPRKRRATQVRCVIDNIANVSICRHVKKNKYNTGQDSMGRGKVTLSHSVCIVYIFNCNS